MWEGVNTSLYKTQKLIWYLFIFFELNIAQPVCHSLEQLPFFQGIYKILQNLKKKITK